MPNDILEMPTVETIQSAGQKPMPCEVFLDSAPLVFDAIYFKALVEENASASNPPPSLVLVHIRSLHAASYQIQQWCCGSEIKETPDCRRNHCSGRDVVQTSGYRCSPTARDCERGLHPCGVYNLAASWAAL